MNEDSLIKKKTLHVGTKFIPFKEGTKVYFHFQTRLCDNDCTIIDDSRKMGKGEPMPMVLGKKFKLEVWEVLVQKLALNEVAEFVVDKSLVMEYPFVAKTMRDLHVPAENRRSTHCCAMVIQTEGIGYEDLNRLLKQPQNLTFIMELLKVEQPEEYAKESWQMNDDEKLDLVTALRQSGNVEFSNKNYRNASDHYAKALGLLEQLMISEKPYDTEWKRLDALKVPLLLNFAQCRLIEKDYYAVIEHCTNAIKSDPSNVKAYYRRAKAHVGAWNPEQALKDFNKVMDLDSSLCGAVKKELAQLEEMQKSKDLDDKEKLQRMFK